MNPQCQAAPERNAFHEASILHSSFFGRPLTASSERQPASDHSKLSTRAQNERMCIGGHRGTIFGVSFSPDGRFLATASQDSTIRIWEVSSNKLVATLTEGLDVKFECLRVAWMDIGGLSSAEPHSSISDRYLLASAGADGVARLWSGFLTGADDDEGNLDWKCVFTLDHFVELKMDGRNSTSSEDPERPQIYALQFIHSNNMPNENLLLTAANDLVCFWTIEERFRPSDRQTEQNANKPTERQLIFHSSLQFARINPSGETYINQFGGARNPDNEIYVFDSEFSEASNLVGAALSDGTCRIVSLDTTVDTTNDAINEKQCVLSLPPGYFPGARGGHLTALSWDKTGRRMATCIASGRVVLWTIAKEENDGYLSLNPSCVAILNGGHDPGRPLFGAKYCGGTDERILLTWGTDGKLCAWDSCSSGENRTPMCTLITHENYPIYTLDITNNTEATTQHIALGGGSDEGFLGVPTYIYDVSRE